MEGDFRMAHEKGMECCTDHGVSWFGLGVGRRASPVLPALPTVQCGVKSTNGRTRESKGGRAGAAGKFRQAEAEDIREALL